MNTGLPPYTTINVLAVYDTVVFAGIGASADRALYYSLDDGAHWIEGSLGLRSSCGDIWALAVSDTNLFAGIRGCEPSVWRRPLSEIITSVENSTDDLPTDFSLSQNYPNPFNPTTKIRYSVPTESYVSLKVCNLLGQEIQTLVSDVRRAGFYEAEFDASNLPSGVYFYRLQAGGFSETKTLVLLR